MAAGQAEQKATNIKYETHHVSRDNRSEALSQRGGKFRGCTIWLTGLLGAGKRTIAFAVEEYLLSKGISAYSLHADNIRHGINKSLGFSPQDREENIRRISEVSKLFADGGIVCLTSFISPFRKDRDEARRSHEQAGLAFIECYVNTSMDICEQRDVKGLYQKARGGKIKGVTGVDQIYEEPLKPDLVLRAGDLSLDECAQQLVSYLLQRGIVPESAMKSVKELFVGDEMKAATVMEAESLPRLDMTPADMEWLQVLSEGWATPLNGFMSEKQFLQCQHFGCLLTDVKVNQSLPVVLPVSADDRQRLDGVDAMALAFHGRSVAVLRRPELYEHRKEERCSRQFGSTDVALPHVKMVYESGDWLCGGDVEVLERVRWNDGLDEYRLTPCELRQRFRQLNADVVIAFQPRQPLHNGHALLIHETRRTLKERGYTNPVLLLQPLGDWAKTDGVPLSWRMKQYEAMLDSLDRTKTVLAIFPSRFIHAGPSELQWQAKAASLAGANVYLVDSDTTPSHQPNNKHDLHCSTQASEVLKMAPGLDQLDVVPFRITAYNKKTNTMDFFNADRKDDFLFISGTRMRELARNGNTPPEGIMPPKAWAVIVEYYQSFRGAGN